MITRYWCLSLKSAPDAKSQTLHCHYYMIQHIHLWVTTSQPPRGRRTFLYMLKRKELVLSNNCFLSQSVHKCNCTHILICTYSTHKIKWTSYKHNKLSLSRIKFILTLTDKPLLFTDCSIQPSYWAGDSWWCTGTITAVGRQIEERGINSSQFTFQL